MNGWSEKYNYWCKSQMSTKKQKNTTTKAKVAKLEQKVAHVEKKQVRVEDSRWSAARAGHKFKNFVSKAEHVTRAGTFKGEKMSGATLVDDGGFNSGQVRHNRGIQQGEVFNEATEKVCNVYQNVTNSQPFQIPCAYWIQPGNSGLHPIFSTIAASYTEWMVLKMVFTYVADEFASNPNGGVTSGGQAGSGVFAMATNYDTDAGAFADLDEIENYSNSVRGKPYAGMRHDVMKGNHRAKNTPLRRYFVYYSDNISGPTGDDKWYSLGLFQGAMSGGPVAALGSSPIGELYVTYKYVMYGRRQIPTNTPVLMRSLHGQEFPSNTATNAAPFGTTTLLITTNVSGDNTIAYAAPAAPTSSLILPLPGIYLYVMSVATVSGITGTPNVGTFGTNISELTTLGDGSQQAGAAWTTTTGLFITDRKSVV